MKRWTRKKWQSDVCDIRWTNRSTIKLWLKEWKRVCACKRNILAALKSLTFHFASQTGHRNVSPQRGPGWTESRADNIVHGWLDIRRFSLPVATAARHGRIATHTPTHWPQRVYRTSIVPGRLSTRRLTGFLVGRVQKSNYGEQELAPKVAVVTSFGSVVTNRVGCRILHRFTQLYFTTKLWQKQNRNGT